MNDKQLGMNYNTVEFLIQLKRILGILFDTSDICRGPLALPRKHREEVGLTCLPKDYTYLICRTTVFR